MIAMQVERNSPGKAGRFREMMTVVEKIGTVTSASGIIQVVRGTILLGTLLSCASGWAEIGSPEELDTASDGEKYDCEQNDDCDGGPNRFFLIY